MHPFLYISQIDTRNGFGYTFFHKLGALDAFSDLLFIRDVDLAGECLVQPWTKVGKPSWIVFA